MITMAMYSKIRRMYYREGVSISEIVRRTSLSRNTVRKWLKQADGGPRYRRVQKTSKLGAFEAQLCQALAADAHRRPRERRTALKLLEELRAAGYRGGYSQLTAYIRRWRSQGSTGKTAYVPLTFALGEAFQFDWSEESLLLGGIPRKVQLAHVKLCASRAFFLVAYPTQRHEMLFDAHHRAFEAFGGVPRRGIYDNMKTAVDRVGRGKGLVVNTRFHAMCAHYLIEADFCNVASGWEKGVVEKNVQDSRRRVWQAAAQQRFSDFAELNAWLAGRCRQLWGELAHPEYRQVSVAEALEHEAGYLMPVPAAFDGYSETLSRVSSTCLISVERNRYSVPCEHVGQMVSVRLYPQRLVVVSVESVIAEHARSHERDQVIYDWQHYIPLVERKPGALRNGAPFAQMPAAFRQLHKALSRREGGERVMARVLSAVPVNGLEAVVVAVELVLESGNLSAEHVMNVLGRLRPDAPVRKVETALALKEAPRADPARYDRLRDEEVDHA